MSKFTLSQSLFSISYSKFHSCPPFDFGLGKSIAKAAYATFGTQELSNNMVELNLTQSSTLLDICIFLLVDDSCPRFRLQP